MKRMKPAGGHNRKPINPYNYRAEPVNLWISTHASACLSVVTCLRAKGDGRLKKAKVYWKTGKGTSHVSRLW
jgi:hypothetical protein